MKIPMFIQRCLAYGVGIYPYELKTMLRMAEIHSIPDEEISEFNKEQIEKYIRGLYLSGQEMSREWTKGHELLKEIGFKEEKRDTGFRSFVGLYYEPLEIS